MPTTKIKILLIEDNAGDFRLLKELLNYAHPGKYKISSVATLNEGLEILVEGKFDIVLTDLNLPDSEGTNKVKLILEHDEAIPIVVLIGQDSEELALQVCTYGCPGLSN